MPVSKKRKKKSKTSKVEPIRFQPTPPNLDHLGPWASTLQHRARIVQERSGRASLTITHPEGYNPGGKRKVDPPLRITEEQLVEFGKSCEVHTRVPEKVTLSEDGRTLYIVPGNKDDDDQYLADRIWILLDPDMGSHDDEEREEYYNSPTWAEDFIEQENVEVTVRMERVTGWMARDYPNYGWAEVECEFEQPFTEVAVEKLKEMKRALDPFMAANPHLSSYDAMRQLNPYGAYDRD